MKKLFLILFVLLSFGLAGCSSNPLGMSDAEWDALTSEQQHEARMAQAEIDREAAERRAEGARVQAEEERRANELRRTADYGDVVQCTITNATGRMSNGNWYPIQDVSVELHRTESDRQVRIAQADRPTRGETMHMGFDGSNVKVCRWYNRDCDVLAGSERAFADGVTKRINVNRLVEGDLTCSLPRRHAPRKRIVIYD